ncbi:DNA replication licensing factor MCM6 [Babesia caballi]|uniref:DNA replication licensing factor MCM6 n=1 Tax=Babesia caballi TaxID=5871 RepID=A0AAV4LWP7_BABCB|nr:DNA replication licensing factor MCM6 [Babesia caballi]
MFKCRVCSIVPFASFLGLIGAEEEDDEPHLNRRLSREDDFSPSLNGSDASCASYKEDAAPGRRSAEEIAYLVKAWDACTHERAKAFWKTPAQRYAILSSIAKGCARSDDPVTGVDGPCVRWYGAMQDDYPVIPIRRPGDTKDSMSYVNRMLVFFFADAQSFEQIDKEVYRAFKMHCGNRWCVSVTHILLS